MKFEANVPMIANVSKNNTGKLLVAVLAMAMIVAGAAVVLGGSVSADPVFNDEKTEVTVSTSEDLLTAIDGVNNSTEDYASVTTIILDGDEFDVTTVVLKSRSDSIDCLLDCLLACDIIHGLHLL